MAQPRVGSTMTGSLASTSGPTQTNPLPVQVLMASSSSLVPCLQLSAPFSPLLAARATFRARQPLPRHAPRTLPRPSHPCHAPRTPCHAPPTWPRPSHPQLWPPSFPPPAPAIQCSPIPVSLLRLFPPSQGRPPGPRTHARLCFIGRNVISGSQAPSRGLIHK